MWFHLKNEEVGKITSWMTSISTACMVHAGDCGVEAMKIQKRSSGVALVDCLLRAICENGSGRIEKMHEALGKVISR